MFAQFLHFDHVPVVHGGNDQFGLGMDHTGAHQSGHKDGSEAKFHVCLLDLELQPWGTGLADRGGIVDKASTANVYGNRQVLYFVANKDWELPYKPPESLCKRAASAPFPHTLGQPTRRKPRAKRWALVW
jgi:hypothetical protein